MHKEQEKVGLFVTRVQPGLHYGQLDALEQAISQGITKVLVGIGSSQKEFVKDNPFTFLERKEMVRRSVGELSKDLDVEIYDVPDFDDNEKWREYLARELPPFEYVISGNPKVWTAFKDKEDKIIPVEVRKMIKATDIREKIKRGDKLALGKLLPSAVLEYLGEIDAYQRFQQIFADEYLGPRVAVDVVMLSKEGKIILIKRRDEPYGVALPGGFMEQESARSTAMREAKEEMNADIQTLDLLGEWSEPERDPRGHNMSVAFTALQIGGVLQAGDDAKEIFEIDPDEKSLEGLPWAFSDHKEMVKRGIQSLKNGGLIS